MTAATPPFDLVLRGGCCLTPNGREILDIGIRGDTIHALGDLGLQPAATTLDIRGLHVLPGPIDTQVHFREPGLTAKEDLETGSRAAVAGGVTTVFEMPNTAPPTTDATALADKLRRAQGRMWCHHAFFIGATADPETPWEHWERLPGCAGIKLFLGSSTGPLLVDDQAALERLFARSRRRMPVHAEDETRLRERRALAERAGHPRAHPVWRDEQAALIATRRIVALANAFAHPLHVLHVTTAEEMALLADHKTLVSVEVTPQHLTLVAPEAYERLGTLAQMNPPLRDERHRRALWAALAEGVVDVIGSDHAPHTLEEKRTPYPNSPSGMPGVQFLLPIMLDHVHRGHLTLERLVDLTASGPARLYGIRRKGRIARGFDADLAVVDTAQRQRIDNQRVMSRCGWTPYHDTWVTGWPRFTVVAGQLAMADGELQGSPQGRPVAFFDTLPTGSGALAPRV